MTSSDFPDLVAWEVGEFVPMTEEETRSLLDRSVSVGREPRDPDRSLTVRTYDVDGTRAVEGAPSGVRRRQFVNVVTDVRLPVVFHWFFPKRDTAAMAIPIALVPFLWAGVAIIGKKGQPFWKKIVSAFCKALQIILVNSWRLLGDKLAGDGQPGSMEQGHQDTGALEEIGQNAESSGWKARYPWEDTPSSTAKDEREGLRLWVLVPGGRQVLPIRKADKMHFNRKTDVTSQNTIVGWRLPPGAYGCAMLFYDKDGKYDDNDGDCYGSFSLWEPR